MREQLRKYIGDVRPEVLLTLSSAALLARPDSLQKYIQNSMNLLSEERARGAQVEAKAPRLVTGAPLTDEEVFQP